MVNVPLSMMIVWKGRRPDGTVVASLTRPEMKSFTQYTSSTSPLTSVDSADVFQLRLKSVGICQQYSEVSHN